MEVKHAQLDASVPGYFVTDGTRCMHILRGVYISDHYVRLTNRIALVDADDCAIQQLN